MNCPDCETELTYSDKCRCGWFKRVEIPELPSIAEKVKEKVTNKAAEEAKAWIEQKGWGRKEGESYADFVKRIRSIGLESLKNFGVKGI
jgi:broad specificity phosphatase PhoE